MKSVRLSDLSDQFDVFLIDQFGVLIDGAGAYDGAAQAMQFLIDAGKTVIVLTNSGKRAVHTRARLEGHGFDMANVQVVSSGEVARALLTTRFAGQSGPLAVWYEAENTDASPLDGLGVRYVSDIREADLVMIAGVRSEDASLGTFRDGFQHAIQRGVPCICTNPDHERLTFKGVRFAAGQIAQLYQDMGGQVEWIGKPFGAMYEHAINLAAEGAKIVCLGDSIAHDIKGARDAGLQSALVLTGLTNEEDLTTLCPEYNAWPDYLLRAFRLS
ncbi:MAG: TIGR01459 family HAD-type hydrolase [Paracoccaceae bacterium]